MLLLKDLELTTGHNTSEVLVFFYYRTTFTLTTNQV